MPAAPWRLGEWRKSSYSDASNGCVKACLTAVGVELGDTKQRGAGPLIRFSHDEWERFLSDALDGAARTNGVADIDTAPLVLDYPDRRAHTRWHVRAAGNTLHFTEKEWHAFRLGAAEGEFTVQVSDH
ncbi:MAG TPA: DUF397 domain-containing protein [Pseudonocardia sp.]|jgi:hypothetical protein|uniref:DUF397 domain-containing protein n=1 Tax=Pseudonocardia sp. TaxID=60912 RepID=UPI002F41726B